MTQHDWGYIKVETHCASDTELVVFVTGGWRLEKKVRIQTSFRYLCLQFTE